MVCKHSEAAQLDGTITSSVENSTGTGQNDSRTDPADQQSLAGRSAGVRQTVHDLLRPISMNDDRLINARLAVLTVLPGGALCAYRTGQAILTVDARQSLRACNAVSSRLTLGSSRTGGASRTSLTVGPSGTGRPGLTVSTRSAVLTGGTCRTLRAFRSLSTSSASRTRITLVPLRTGGQVRGAHKVIRGLPSAMSTDLGPNLNVLAGTRVSVVGSRSRRRSGDRRSDEEGDCQAALRGDVHLSPFVEAPFVPSGKTLQNYCSLVKRFGKSELSRNL